MPEETPLRGQRPLDAPPCALVGRTSTTSLSVRRSRTPRHVPAGAPRGLRKRSAAGVDSGSCRRADGTERGIETRVEPRGRAGSDHGEAGGASRVSFALITMQITFSARTANLLTRRHPGCKANFDKVAFFVYFFFFF